MGTTVPCFLQLCLNPLKSLNYINQRDKILCKIIFFDGWSSIVKDRVILNRFYTYFIGSVWSYLSMSAYKSCRKVDNERSGVRKIREFLQPCWYMSEDSCRYRCGYRLEALCWYRYWYRYDFDANTETKAYRYRQIYQFCRVLQGGVSKFFPLRFKSVS